MRYSDEHDYHQLAVSLLHEHTFALEDATPTAYRPPGYPVAIALAYLVAERPLLAKLENVLSLLAAGLALCTIASRIHAGAAPVTPFLLLAYPLLGYAASLLYPQVLGCLLLCATTLCLTSEPLSRLRSALAGAIYGYLILAIPSFVLILPIFSAYVLFRRDLTRLAGFGRALLFSSVAVLIVAPWTARNYFDFHTLIPVSANSGLNLFLGNSARTTANSGVIDADVISLCKRARADMNGIELDRALSLCATDWIRENPGSAAKLYAAKVVNYFNFRNELATKNASSSWSDWLLFATYYPLLSVAAVRLFVIRRFPLSNVEVLIYLLYLGNAFISAIYFTRIRFRIPFDFLLIAVVAGFIATRWDLWRARSGKGASGNLIL
jgi:hypothetical protein